MRHYRIQTLASNYFIKNRISMCIFLKWIIGLIISLNILISLSYSKHFLSTFPDIQDNKPSIVHFPLYDLFLSIEINNNGKSMPESQEFLIHDYYSKQQQNHTNGKTSYLQWVTDHSSNPFFPIYLRGHALII